MRHSCVDEQRDCDSEKFDGLLRPTGTDKFDPCTARTTVAHNNIDDKTHDSCIACAAYTVKNRVAPPNGFGILGRTQLHRTAKKSEHNAQKEHKSRISF